MLNLKSKNKPVLSAFLFLFMLLPAAVPARALDLGGSNAVAQGGGAEAAKVEVVNDEPVKVLETEISQLIEIKSGIQLQKGGEYRSPYMDVKNFRRVSFYVLPEKVLNDPHGELSYRLDAYFSGDMSTIEYQKAGKEEPEIVGNEGASEFGYMNVREGAAEIPAFVKMTTGTTNGNRVLSTPVYGPYLRVSLKNFTEDDRRKFKIMAFLTK